MDPKKLVTFAFATKRRKLAMLTMAGIAGVSSLVGGDAEPKPASRPAAATAEAPATTVTTAPATSTTTAATAPPTTRASVPPTTAATSAPAVSSDECDGVHFNIPVAAGDKRDRDGDGIACEKN